MTEVDSLKIGSQPIVLGRQAVAAPSLKPGFLGAGPATGQLHYLWNLVQKRTIHYSRGGTIYWQGDHADTVFLNVKGTVLLKVFSPAGKEGVLEVVASGELFGESCLFDSELRTSSAIALEPTTVIAFDKHGVRSALRTSPDCVEALMRHLVARTRQLHNQLTDQLFSSSELRLARFLRMLAHGREMKDGFVLIPRISQSMLASMVGTTRSRICFFLVRFRKLELVDNRDGMRVCLAKMDELLAQ